MIQVNEYFDGKVKSLVVQGVAGKETMGVMEPGEYTFNTSQKEIITVVTGAMIIKQKDADEWEIYQRGDAFEVPANSSFQIKIYVTSGYICQYL